MISSVSFRLSLQLLPSSKWIVAEQGVLVNDTAVKLSQLGAGGQLEAIANNRVIKNTTHFIIFRSARVH